MPLLRVTAEEGHPLQAPRICVSHRVQGQLALPLLAFHKLSFRHICNQAGAHTFIEDVAGYTRRAFPGYRGLVGASPAAALGLFPPQSSGTRCHRRPPVKCSSAWAVTHCARRKAGEPDHFALLVAVGERLSAENTFQPATGYLHSRPDACLEQLLDHRHDLQAGEGSRIGKAAPAAASQGATGAAASAQHLQM